MDVLDGYEKDSVRLGVKVAGLSAEVIAKGMMWLLNGIKNKVFPAEVIGKTSIKQLMKKGDKLLSQDVKNPDLKLLYKTLKRYNIGFSVIQHEGTNNYTLFFKAKNDTQLDEGLRAYIAKTMTREKPEKQLAKETEPVKDQSKVLEQDRDMEDVSFSAERQPEPKVKQPEPRSIPRELEEAKAVSKAMQQSHDIEKQLLRQRTKGHER